MKRLFALVLAICMIATMFAGCGQQAGTPTEPKADQAGTNEGEKKEEKPAKDVDLAFFTYWTRSLPTSTHRAAASLWSRNIRTMRAISSRSSLHPAKLLTL